MLNVCKCEQNFVERAGIKQQGANHPLKLKTPKNKLRNSSKPERL